MNIPVNTPFNMQDMLTYKHFLFSIERTEHSYLTQKQCQPHQQNNNTSSSSCSILSAHSALIPLQFLLYYTYKLAFDYFLVFFQVFLIPSAVIYGGASSTVEPVLSHFN